ncbi:Uncharacterised protein [Vibrio cholerae]|nr:Uncharacterised protein [Vibrio cholerae]
MQHGDGWSHHIARFNRKRLDTRLDVTHFITTADHFTHGAAQVHQMRQLLIILPSMTIQQGLNAVFLNQDV